MSRAGRWIVAALGGAVVWTASVADVPQPALGEGGAPPLVEAPPLRPGPRRHPSAAPAVPSSAGSLVEREGAEGAPTDDPRSSGGRGAGSLLSGALPGALPATPVSAAVAARDAAARAGLLSSGRRAPPSPAG